MKDYTTMGTGGTANMIVLSELGELMEIYKQCRKPFFFLGNGSNIIVKDSGMPGTVIKNELKSIKVKDDCIKVQSGMMLMELSHFALHMELSGLEFAEGIPGTIGGAIYMNAGYRKNEDMASIVTRVVAMDNSKYYAKTIVFNKKQCEFAFRSSIFQKNKYFIISADLQLKRKPTTQIDKTITENHKLRVKIQPQRLSAGSIFKPFKNKNRYYGLRIGGAEFVSPGFIINHGTATTNDIQAIIRKIQSKEKAILEVEIL